MLTIIYNLIPLDLLDWGSARRRVVRRRLGTGLTKISTSVARKMIKRGTSQPNRGKSCFRVISVVTGMYAAGAISLRLVWVFGLIRFGRLVGIDVPDARLVLVDIGKVGHSDPPPTIDDDCDNEANEKYP